MLLYKSQLFPLPLKVLHCILGSNLREVQQSKKEGNLTKYTIGPINLNFSNPLRIM